MYDKTLDNNLSFASGIYLFIIFTIFMPVSKNLSVMIILLYLYKHATLKRYTFGYSSMSVYIWFILSTFFYTIYFYIFYIAPYINIIKFTQYYTTCKQNN